MTWRPGRRVRRSSRANGVEVAVEVELDAIIVFQIPTYDRYCVGTGWIARCPRIWKLEYCGDYEDGHPYYEIYESL